ncbi:kelch-like protein 7 [Antedon mediterranea]|uniref:kelch-like protein 7 n=1 Tax=Antedon mediterranea TaxID=105859 RepID=UPI003AF8A66B
MPIIFHKKTHIFTTCNQNLHTARLLENRQPVRNLITLDLRLTAGRSGKSTCRVTVVQKRYSMNGNIETNKTNSPNTVSRRRLGSLTTINKMRQNTELCDVTILVQNETFHVHRLVMSACSEFFRVMFNSTMTESSSKTIQLSNYVTPAAVGIIINFAYTGELDIHPSNVQEVLTAAHYFQIDDVIQSCVCILSNELSISNCLGIWKLSSFLNCESLRTESETMICESFIDVSKTEEFMQLSLEVLLELLGKDGIMVRNEDEVYRAAERWWLQDSAVRDVDKPSVFLALRTPYLSSATLHNVCQDEDIIVEKNCVKKIFEAIWYQTLGPNRDTASNIPLKDPVKPRIKKSNIQVAFLSGHQNFKHKLFDPVKLIWADAKLKKLERVRFTATSVSSRVYIFGDVSSSSRPTDIDMFDFSTMRLTTGLLKLSPPRDSVAACTVEEQLVVSGGSRDEGRKTIRNCEYYDLRTNTRLEIAQMNKSRHRHGLVYTNGFVMACGGYISTNHEHGPLYECEVMVANPVPTGRWHLLSGLHFGRIDLGLAAVDGKVFAIGGQDRDGAILNSVEYLDISKCSTTEDVKNCNWKFATSLPVPLTKVKCTVVGTSIFVIGGTVKFTPYQDRLMYVLEYQVPDNCWRLHKSTPACGSTWGAVVTVDLCA